MNNQLDSITAKFISKNKELINENKWLEVYQNASMLAFSNTNFIIGKFTELLFKAGIHPEYFTGIILPSNFLCNSTLSEYAVPDGIKVIKDAAFDSSTISKITLPSTLVTICKYAFYKCEQLTEITIPDNVIDIQACAFLGCKNLKEINLPGSLLTINESMFADCHNLQSATLNEGIEVIGDAAFSVNESLKNLTLPRTLIRIHTEAFEYCTNLTNITYNGTIEEWSCVEIKSRAFEKVPTSTITCIDGTTKLRH